MLLFYELFNPVLLEKKQKEMQQISDKFVIGPTLMHMKILFYPILVILLYIWRKKRMNRNDDSWKYMTEWVFSMSFQSIISGT